MEGKLKLNTDGKQVDELPFTVHADLHFHELMQKLAAQDTNWQSLRHYVSAEAKIQIGDQTFPSRLAQDHTSVQVESTGDALQISPLRGQFTREELDLLRVQGDSATLARLLPTQPVAVGESWQHNSQVLTSLLHIDAISQSEVSSILQQISDGTAQMELQGELAGAVDGVATEIQLTGKYTFDLTQRQITWLALSIQERRAVGHAEPGFDVTARVRVALAPLAASPPLEAATRELKADSKPEADRAVERARCRLLRLKSEKGGFSLAHERAWHVLLDRHDVTILRLVDRGDLIAQCNVSKIPANATPQPPTVAAFQEEVQKALGKNFGQTVEAAEVMNGQQVRILRVVAGGVSSELPIVWIYYHFSDATGRRAAGVVTMEAKYLERFADLDRNLLETFRFEDVPAPVPAPAPAPAPVPAQAQRATRSPR